MKRILHLISQLEEGGAQRQLAYVLKHGKQYETEVASLIASPPEKRFSFFKKSDVPVHYLSHSNDFYDPQIIPALKKLIQQGSYDLVHCWMFETIIQGVLVCRELKVPCIAGPRNSVGMLSYHKRWERTFLRQAFQLADIVVFPSSSAGVDFLDYGWISQSRVRIVRNGVDCSVFAPAAAEGAGVVAIGRMSPEKGYDDLLAAIAILRKDHPEIQCRVAGSGVPPQGGAVDFVGPLEDASTFLREGSIYVSTSRVEGMSNALLEAQSTGLPVVVRKIGGNSEVVRHEITGILCETVEDFAEGMDRLLSDSALRRSMGQAARDRIESKFSISGQVAKLEAVYSELL